MVYLVYEESNENIFPLMKERLYEVPANWIEIMELWNYLFITFILWMYVSCYGEQG
jgi:hypothetical protein